MIQICARPTKEPVVNREGVYAVGFKLGPSGYKTLLKVRARTAALAEEKMMFVFEHELSGKVLDFRIEDFKGKENQDGMQEQEDVR